MMTPIQNSLVPRLGLIFNFVICVKDFNKFSNGAKLWKSKSIINLCLSNNMRWLIKIGLTQKTERLSYAKKKKNSCRKWA